jgi:tetratricopeptide (TPR) repeat protein
MISRFWPTLAAIFLVTVSIWAQMPGMAPTAEKPTMLLPGLGTLHHKVSTRSALAQKYFDQGLRLIYAFNHDEAVRSFQRAAELDPKLAMAYWGIGFASGPNINRGDSPEVEKVAFEATQQALKLADGAPANERAYINALAKRYSIDPNVDHKKLAADFHQAMGEVMRRYPNDLDAATIYAESGMDLHPWKLWSNDGKPNEGTEEIVTVLESVLRRNPNHVGAIHYYIHALEASPHPERALPYVAKLPAQMPTAGHLVHMPSHIYIRTGDYLAAAKSNADAIVADDGYIKRTGASGEYTTMYYNHNVDFLAVADGMAGDYAGSMKAVQHLEDDLAPVVMQIPMIEGFLWRRGQLMVRFHKWDEILALPQPAGELKLATANWHFVRGMAFTGLGKAEQGNDELAQFRAQVAALPEHASFGFSRASKLFAVAENELEGRIALANHDEGAAIAAFERAVTSEDLLAYDEPPDWIVPAREMLGGALLRQGNFVEAEKVFRADLAINRKNGRSLFGLAESLKAQGKVRAAAMARRQFAVAWRKSDTKLVVADL